MALVTEIPKGASSRPWLKIDSRNRQIANSPSLGFATIY